MLKEIEKAVETFHRIALGAKKNAIKSHQFITEAKLSSFVTVLTELLVARYEKNWYPENPDRASGYRCIRVNAQCVDPTIVESLKRAKIGLPKGLIRTELTIWVDPGVVSVRIGEEGSIGSEVVDEEVYRLGLKPKEQAKQSSDAMSEDSGIGSRSSSPASVNSDRSGSSSPPVARSPTQSPVMSSPPPPMEYNPYCPPHRFQRNCAQPAPSNMSPAARRFQQPGSQGRPVMPAGSVMTSSPQDVYHIPVSNSRAPSYSRPRSLFPAQDNGSNMEGYGKVTYNAYAMGYGNNFLQGNYLDIPAMA